MHGQEIQFLVLQDEPDRNGTCPPRFPSDHADLDLAVAREAVFESVFRAWDAAPTCELHSLEPSSDSTRRLRDRIAEHQAALKGIPTSCRQGRGKRKRQQASKQKLLARRWARLARKIEWDYVSLAKALRSLQQVVKIDAESDMQAQPLRTRPRFP